MTNVNSELTRLRQDQQALLVEFESLNAQVSQKRELLLKYQGVIEYLTSRESQEKEEEEQSDE